MLRMPSLAGGRSKPRGRGPAALSWRALSWQALALLGGALVGGCVTLELPTIAHVHVGHVVTAWPQTPGQKALFETALADAAVAVAHAGYAVDGARDAAAVRLHLGHVLHAADPQREATGPGSGYGLVRALDDSSDHLGFAQEVPDASANLKAGLPALIGALQPLRREARAIAALAAEGRSTRDAATALAYAQELQQRTHALAAQLHDVRQRVTLLLAAEQPPYRVLPRRYLFGLVRLPSGAWGFDPATRQGAYR